MKKREKTSLKFKESIYKFALSYFSLFMSIHFMGGFQTILNFKEVKQYEEVMDDFGEFLKENEIENPIDIFDYFNFALWEGYLSKDQDYAYSEKRNIYFDNYGMGNIEGRGVCLNDAGMLSDLYKSLGYDSEIVLCYVPVGKINIDYDTRTNGSITRRVETSDSFASLSKILAPVSFFTGNHAITVVEYEGEYYYFDPTNLAYLAKSDINDLDIINGDGTFKKRYFTSVLYELFGGLKNTFGVTNDDYNLEYLTSRENIEINVDKLEEFYRNEKELIDGIADSLNSKPQLVIFILALLLSGVFSNNLKTSIDNIFSKKYRVNENLLRGMITSFLGFNSIKKFEDVCSYLHYLINNGYLSYERGNEELNLRKSLIVDSPSLVTVDKDAYGSEFFTKFINTYFTRNQLVIGIDDDGRFDSFHMNKNDDGKYVFYSYSQNLLFHLNDYGELVSGDKKYKLVKLFKGKLIKSEKFSEDMIANIDETLCDEFYETNKDNLEKIAKSYAYVKENK